jgi:hypothetical protein
MPWSASPPAPRARGSSLAIVDPDPIIQAEGVPGLACAIVKKPYAHPDILAAVAQCLA